MTATLQTASVGPAQVGPRTPQDYQRTFNQLPEQRKGELARVVAGIAQTQGKHAAQRWLEQQLEPHMPVKGSLHVQLDTLLGKVGNSVAERNHPRAYEDDEITPNRARLAAQAPTTLAVLSEEQKAFQSAVEAAEPFSQEQLELIAPALTPQSVKVLQFLHLYACSNALSREQSLKAHQISFFLPAETIHLATGVPKRTVYDALRRIKALRMIDYRGHVTTLAKHGNRCDGTVFAVKLSVLRTGEARVTYEDLKITDYRDLEEDIDAGRTVYCLAQSGTWVSNLKNSLCRLLSWIQSKCTQLWDAEPLEPRTLTMQASSSHGLEAILEVTRGTAATRGQRIGRAAKAIGCALGDQHSLPFWWRFCDALACLVERGGRDYSLSILACMQRELTAKREGFARNAAALFIARLKASGVYGEIMA